MITKIVLAIMLLYMIKYCLDTYDGFKCYFTVFIFTALLIGLINL